MPVLAPYLMLQVSLCKHCSCGFRYGSLSLDSQHTVSGCCGSVRTADRYSRVIVSAHIPNANYCCFEAVGSEGSEMGKTCSSFWGDEKCVKNDG